MPKRYDSDLTDAQWQAIAPMIPVQRSRSHPPRQMLDAMLYLVKTGCQWRLLPDSFPPWTAVYYRFRRWLHAGVLMRLHEALRAAVRVRAGRKAAPSAAVLDSQAVKTSMLGGVRGFDVGKRVKGRKRHLLVDTMGLIISLAVHLAACSDSRGSVLVLRRTAAQHLRHVWADANYAWVPRSVVDRLIGARLEVEPRGHPSRSRTGFTLERRRWVVERTFGWFEGYRRLSKHFERQCATSEAMIRLAMTRLMLNRL